MPAQDLYHDLVRDVLRKDGWRVTHNPLRLRKPRQTRQTVPDDTADLAEAFLLGAEQDERKIAVAVKSFVGLSNPSMLEQALETLTYSRTLLRAMERDRVLYLAIRRATYEAFHDGTVEPQFLPQFDMPLLIFEPRLESIIAWLPNHNAAPHSDQRL